MCIPLAVAALAVSAAGVGVAAYGAYKSGKANQESAAQASADAKIQAQLANFNADQALAYGDLNANQTLALQGINDKITEAVGDANVQIAQMTTDFNVAIREGNAALDVAHGAAEGQIHDLNARMDEVNARSALDAGNQAEQQSRMRYSQLTGQQRASLAASGVALDEGSALRVQTDTAFMSETDAATIKTNALKTAWGYRVDWANEKAQAAQARLTGQEKAMGEMADATIAKLASEVSIANTKMTTSFNILQGDMAARISAENTRADATSKAMSYREQALGYTSTADAAAHTASAINPGLAAGGTLLQGAGQVASQWYTYHRDGAI